jgi:hypothetical protein
MTAKHAQSTRDTDYPPEDYFLEKIGHGLEQARSKVANLHGSMRKAANAYSRSRIRSLNILDLPDELLRTIFKRFMEGSMSSGDHFYIPDYGYQNGLKDIKNIRLTCQRFCNTSSHLLLRHIDVTMRPSSLTRLKEVACHPLLSKGVQAVRVHLNYFSASLATDIFHFATLAIMHLEHSLEFFKGLLRRNLDEKLFNMPREEIGPAIDKGALILEEWSEFLNVLRDSDEDPDVFKGGIANSREVAGLVSAHEIYRQQYLAQESVLKDGTFLQVIVTAMSKMPTAKRLFVGDLFSDFEDGRYEYVKPFVDAVEDPESLAASRTVMSLDWAAARSNGLDDQPKEIFLQLMMAVFDIDIQINYLCINSSSAADLLVPATQEQLQHLAARTEQLRVFALRGSVFGTDVEPIFDYGPEQIASLCSLISSCRGGKALTRLDIDMNFTLHKFAPRPLVSMGPLLVSRHCPDLRALSLSVFPLHLRELKTFLGGLNGPLCITLFNVLLLSGTWAEALDLIRQKANYLSFMARQRGAECDDMSEEDIMAIFGKERIPLPGEHGEATRYIRGYAKENPLRIREGTSASAT